MSKVEFSFDLPERWKPNNARRDDDTADTTSLSISHHSSLSSSRRSVARSRSERSLASRSGSERSLSDLATADAAVDTSSLEYSDPDAAPAQKWRTRISARVRRFSIQQSELHDSFHDSSGSFSFDPEEILSEDDDDEDSLHHEKQYKMVRFSMAQTIRHEGTEMTEDEWNKCFYDRDSIKKFQSNASKAAKELVTKKEGFAALWSVSPKNIDVVQCFADTYSACGRARSERAMRRAGNMVPRETLMEIYHSYDVAGLEKLFLEPFRGGNNSTGSSSSAESFQGCVLAQVKDYSALAHFVHNSSRPSRLLALELAKALAAAVAADTPLDKVAMSSPPRRRGRRQSTCF